MSNENSPQESLFQDPVGLQLQRARSAASLSIEQVGHKLKLPVAIIEAMEREDWPRLGAPVYVKSYLGSYLRLLGLPTALADRAAEAKPVPALVPMSSRSRLRHALDTSMRNLVYLAMTAVLVVPVVFLARHYGSAVVPETLTLDPAPASGPAAGTAPDLALPVPGGEGLARDPASPDATAPAETATPDAASAAATQDPQAPVMASLAPFAGTGSAAAAADAPEPLLWLSFSDESWIEVLDAQGRRLERGLVPAGAERRFAPEQRVRVTLGNADAVRVRVAGQALDLAPYRTANVARFAVSSSGEVSTAAQ